jgi:serine/threonine-protein kinase
VAGDELIGRVVGGFEIMARLGDGAPGTRYRARQRRLGRDAILVVLTDAEVATDPTAGDRLRRDAAVGARLEHPAIIPIYAAGEDQDVHYVAWRSVDGEPLDQVLASGRTDGELASSVVGWISSALDHAHARGIPHGALEPSCIVVSSDRVWIGGFRGPDPDDTVALAEQCAADRRALAAIGERLGGPTPARAPDAVPTAAIAPGAIASVTSPSVLTPPAAEPVSRAPTVPAVTTQPDAPGRRGDGRGRVLATTAAVVLVALILGGAIVVARSVSRAPDDGSTASSPPGTPTSAPTGTAPPALTGSPAVTPVTSLLVVSPDLTGTGPARIEDHNGASFDLLPGWQVGQIEILHGTTTNLVRGADAKAAVVSVQPGAGVAQAVAAYQPYCVNQEQVQFAGVPGVHCWYVVQGGGPDALEHLYIAATGRAAVVVGVSPSVPGTEAHRFLASIQLDGAGG